MAHCRKHTEALASAVRERRVDKGVLETARRMCRLNYCACPDFARALAGWSFDALPFDPGDYAMVLDLVSEWEGSIA